jgi:hypothetical protein
MSQSHIDGICLEGLSAPVTIAELRRTHYGGIPNSPGVYLILQASDTAPRFLAKSTGGWFKRKDSGYPPEVVRENWIKGARVVYVGMMRARKGLRGRLRQFFDFGSGMAVGHRGGRLLWHLEDSDSLLVRWRTCAAEEAYANETTAIASFKALYGGRRSYANMAK